MSDNYWSNLGITTASIARRARIELFPARRGKVFPGKFASGQLADIRTDTRV